MFDELYFEPDPFSTRNDPVISSTPIAEKPKDDFNTAPLAPNTLFYLAIIRPHTDTCQIIGPVRKFLHLEPDIMNIIHTSPKAITKMEALRTITDVWGDQEPNHDFAERGFTTFIVQGQRGIYTVLKILRRISRTVSDVLPSPVYTVTSHGPLKYEVKSHLGAPGNKGYADGTSLVGSYVEREDARGAARDAMRRLTEGVEGVRTSETWEKGSKGGGMVLGMVSGVSWEVKVSYEDQVLKRAREEMEREGVRDVGWRH